MSSGRVVETVDVARNAGVRTRLRGIRSGGFLVFQRGEERLSHRVVPAISLATHARYQVMPRDESFALRRVEVDLEEIVATGVRGPLLLDMREIVDDSS